MGRNSDLTQQKELKDSRVPCSNTEQIEVVVVGCSPAQENIKVGNAQKIKLPKEIEKGRIKAYNNGEKQQPENHDR